VVLFREQRHMPGPCSRPSVGALGNARYVRHQLVHDRRIEIAGSIAGIEILTKIAWYYLHERSGPRSIGPASPLSGGRAGSAGAPKRDLVRSRKRWTVT